MTPQPLALADIVALEARQVATGTRACGQTCDDGCHGPLTCARAVHPHDPDGDVAPHAAFDGDGHLIQWTCLPGDHDGLTAQERAAAAAQAAIEARAAATRALYDSIDPTLLVQLLRDGGHLP